jgi:hypothetical protein
VAKQILSAVVSPIGTLLGIGQKKATAAPTPTPTATGPKIMPLADGDAVRAARKKSIAAQLSRGGRTSTMLSGESETLGG